MARSLAITALLIAASASPALDRARDAAEPGEGGFARQQRQSDQQRRRGR